MHKRLLGSRFKWWREKKESEVIGQTSCKWMSDRLYNNMGLKIPREMGNVQKAILTYVTILLKDLPLTTCKCW